MSHQGRKDKPARPPKLPAGLLDAMREPAAVLDANLRIFKAGRAFCRLWGRTPEDAEGRVLSELGLGRTTASTVTAALAPLFEPPAGSDREAAAVAVELPDHTKMELTARRIDRAAGESAFILLTLAVPADNDRAEATPGDSAQRFRVLADAAFEGIAMTQEGVFLDLNDQLARMLGYQRGELLGTPVVNCVAPEHRGLVTEFMAKGRLETYEHRALCKDGTVFPVEVRVRAARIGGRNTRIAAIRDISERSRAENALRMFQFTIDRAAIGCFWIRPDGRFFYVNDQACRSLDYEREALLKMSVMDIHPDLNDEIWAEYWERLLQDKVRTFESTHRRRDGSIFPVEITANYVKFAGRAYSCLFARDITDSKHAEEVLRRFRFSIERASEAVFWLDREGGFPYVNEQACRSLGYSREELMGMRLWDVDPGFTEARWARRWEEMRKAGKRTFEATHRRKDGKVFPVEILSNHIRFGDKEHHVAFVRDISERKQAEAEKAKLESQLFQAQKMESIGRLAGGVAHDFNNMLGVILGYADLMKDRIAEDDPLLKDLQEIEKAAQHSKDITAQLLAFSRKQVIAPRLLDLNARIRSLQKTLGRLIGEDVDLQFFPGDALWPVKFDPSQIEQILINLAVNARDAMPSGGKLTIETVNTHLTDAYCREHVGFTPGDFVQLSVSDNGCGMDSETLSHVFEPFFTTKEVGKGTGLGLATVYGIVQQGGGFINAYSEPGQGTTFKIFLPRLKAEGHIPTETEEVPAAAGTETVLVVEDDDMVRRMTRAMLQRMGYTVRVAETPAQALMLLEEDDSAVDLLMTDVVMPGMNGKELRDRIAALRPDIKTLFMSGYTANVIVQHGVLEEGVHFIQKPFSMIDLAEKVRKALN